MHHPRLNIQAGLIFLLLFLTFESSIMASDTIIRPKRIAVLYFDNSGDAPELEKLKKGLAAMLITDLSRVNSLSVLERARLEDVLKEQNLGRSKMAVERTAARVGKLLGAEIILTGAYFELMGTLRIDARFIDVETGKILKSDGVEGSIKEFFSLEKALLSRMLAGLTVRLSQNETEYLDLSGKEAMISYEDALLFSDALNNTDLGNKTVAAEQLNKVLQRNQGYGPALQALVALNKPVNSAVEPDNTMRGSGDPLKGLNVSKSQSAMQVGNYYALIIGIDQYAGTWSPLKNAVNDARAVEVLLRERYKFDRFKTLYDDQATRSEILKQLEWLVNNVKENDNVFIYYSGHGQFKKALNKGYWVPVDARTDEVSGFISNSDIQTFLAGIPSRHTLLVTDACFSGDIFRGNSITTPFEASEKYYNDIYRKPSRKALTSGGVEPVMDGGKDNHSVFAYYFLKSLRNNEKKYFDAAQLYETIRMAVVNNSSQTPAFHPVRDSGDEGGQFIFIRKQ